MTSTARPETRLVDTERGIVSREIFGPKNRYSGSAIS